MNRPRPQKNHCPVPSDRCFTPHSYLNEIVFEFLQLFGVARAK